MRRILLLHVAGPGEPPFPDLAAAARAARNALAELDGADVEIVVQGPSVGALVAGGPAGDELRTLLEDGVAVAACANSLRSAGLAGKPLVKGVRVVPAAVARLAEAQFDGAAYVRV
ncbi:DsrE family protein [Arthrobacter halodurans]|uniref:DsrE family protein n=1 Tax=Arthrobacter halodurans TaxID=516699 RepID=A0ABV4UPL2_9MICC